MARKRRSFSSSFKAKVALEALKGHHTISELSQRHRIHASQVNLWKKQLLAGAEGIFDSGSGKQKSSEEEPQTAELYEQIGRLNVQLEWLKKKVAQEGE
jgi:transposase